MTTAFGESITLKGGLAMELRMERARTTRDVDLRLIGSTEHLLERLRLAARQDAGDFMVFTIVSDPRRPDIQGEGFRYDGMRFRATCELAGKVYASPFGVDVAVGDPIATSPDLLTTPDVLAFAGIAPPTLHVYPVETHISEKLHAYTMPRDRPNFRIKALPDLALIASVSQLKSATRRHAITQTFTFRATHPVLCRLPAPPDSWTKPYATMAREDGLVWTTLSDVFQAASLFLDPLLGDSITGHWEVESWSWRSSQSPERR